jgi:tRNA modification GTPase
MDGASDTIAALATAPGASGLAVVRVSGADSLAIADRIFTGRRARPSALAPGTFAYGHVHRPDDPAHAVDEAILLVFRAPRSYTREDVVEFQGHGGRASASRLLRAVLDAGARLAVPGEFTRRAFLNGRIDLVQAEAVADLVAARTERAAAAAVEQLDGTLSLSFRTLYDMAIGVAADLETSLDFEDVELPDGWRDNIRRRLNQIDVDIGQLLATWGEGHLLRDGARVVICGPPNAGKSTLMNRLVGRERSIVSDLPGTTRDTIEEDVVLAGIAVRFTDTAGLRTTECAVEKDGVKRAIDSIECADIAIYIVDAGALPSVYIDQSFSFRSRSNGLVVINKTDLVSSVVWPETVMGFKALPCSAKTGAGLDALRAALVDLLGVTESAPPHAVVAERHRQVLTTARRMIQDVRRQMDSDQEDLTVVAAFALRKAIDEIGTITGLTYTDALLDAIFTRFCVGK